MNEYVITAVTPDVNHPTVVHPPAGEGWDVLQMTQGQRGGEYSGQLACILWVRRVDT